jgi:hypothetical protein
MLASSGAVPVEEIRIVPFIGCSTAPPERWRGRALVWVLEGDGCAENFTIYYPADTLTTGMLAKWAVTVDSRMYAR